MKTYISILLLLLSNACFGNRIDELKTPEQVLQFIKKIFGKQDNFHSRNSKDSKAIDFKFIKLDINKDGLTDILINGIRLYAVIDKGKNFEEQYIGMGHFSCELLAIDSSGSLPVFVVQRDDRGERPDTLINLYGGFIEYNASPKQIAFTQIKISTSPCFGTCPIFDLTIDKNRQAVLNAKKYNKISGVFRSEINEATFKDIVGLLSYIKIDSLKDNYDIGWTDNPSIDTEIKYDNTTKKIHDYGLEGTFSLIRLYNILYKLKAAQDWE